MDEDDFCYCHNDDTDEYHDCLDYMECEECTYYYEDLDQAVGQMITVKELIAKLEKVKDKDKPVLFSTWDEDPDYVDVYEYNKTVQIEQEEYD